MSRVELLSGTMASRPLHRFWRWRDLPLAYVLLVWAAFGSSVFFYFNDWPTVPHLAAEVTNVRDDAQYTGSIIIVPANGNRCWQRMLDNRSGKLWDTGYVNCEDVVSKLIEQRKNGSGSTMRLLAIGKALRHEMD